MGICPKSAPPILPMSKDRLRSVFGGSTTSESSKEKSENEEDDNGCDDLCALVLLVIKIVVLAASSFLIFESCGIGYMYDYLVKTTILTAVLFFLGLSNRYVGIVVKPDQFICYCLTETFLTIVTLATAVAYIYFTAEVLSQHPEDTLLFHASFYTSAIHPKNCTTGSELAFVKLGMGLVKYDTFFFMIASLLSATILSVAVLYLLCGPVCALLELMGCSSSFRTSS